MPGGPYPHCPGKKYFILLPRNPELPLPGFARDSRLLVKGSGSLPAFLRTRFARAKRLPAPVRLPAGFAASARFRASRRAAGLPAYWLTVTVSV